MIEKSRNFAVKLSRLKSGENILWIDRKEWGHAACKRLSEPAAPKSAEDLVRHLASDSKWEVRAAIAENLADLPEAIFQDLARLLAGDHNPFVARAAMLALSRRTPITRSAGKSQHDGLQKIIDEIRKKHGSDAAKLAVKLANRQSDEYLRSMAHDVKTLLTSIKDGMNRLEKSAVGTSPPVCDAVSRIAPRIEDLESLTKAINEFARPITLRRTSEDCEQMIEDAVRTARGSIAERGGETSQVETIVIVDPNLKVAVSRAHFVMALTNLIKNAIEAHEGRSGFRKGSVTIEAREDATFGILQISVFDTGGPIEQAELDKLREWIPGGSSKPSGNGFGMPRAKRCIEKHGGTIRIEPNENRGLCFRIQIPI
jgi:signal transduction histidine kinase